MAGRRPAIIPAQEIPDEDFELSVERAAAIDVGKQKGMVAVRVPDPQRPGRRSNRVWEVMARTGDVIELGRQLVELGVQKIAVESTSDYWRIWFYLLEAAGIDVMLVNARQAKNVPGRPKTDKLDAVWLAKLVERGMLMPSFVPLKPIRVLRSYTRLRINLTRDRTRMWLRLEKLLEDALIKVSSVVSKLDTLSTRDMIQALIDGERNPRVLADFARGRLKVKHAELREALTGHFDDHHGVQARILLEMIKQFDQQIDELTVLIDGQLATIAQAHSPAPAANHTAANHTAAAPISPAATPLPAAARLDEIPGISHDTATAIIAEIGLDMTCFPTAAHLCSWAKLAPHTRQSGTSIKNGKTGKGNPYLKGVLGQAVESLSKTDTFLGERYRRLVKRRGKNKTIVAVSRSILVIIWHLLKDPSPRYHDLGADHFTNPATHQRRKHAAIQMLHGLGYQVTLEPLEPAA